MTTPDDDRRRDSGSARAPYHLDIAFEGSCLLLQVEGPQDPKLREHVAEVRRAAEQCGLDVLVRGEDQPSRPGRLV